jgi:hypothetical protein
VWSVQIELTCYTEPVDVENGKKLALIRQEMEMEGHGYHSLGCVCWGSTGGMGGDENFIIEDEMALDGGCTGIIQSLMCLTQCGGEACGSFCPKNSFSAEWCQQQTLLVGKSVGCGGKASTGKMCCAGHLSI